MALRVEEKGFVFSLIDRDTAAVVEMCNPNPEVCIPARVCGRDVVAITDFAFQDCEEVRRLYLPYTLQEIGSNAFSGCTNLETVTQDRLGKSVVIGSGAFAKCSNLKKVLLKTDTIRAGAFLGCTALRTFVFSEDCQYLGPNSFRHCTFTTIMFKGDGSKLIEIMESAFSNAKIENLFSSCSMKCHSPVEECNNLTSVFSEDTKIVCTENSNLNDLAYCGYNVSRWKQ